MDSLTVVIGNGVMLLGRLDGKDGKKLFNPRVMTLEDKVVDGKVIPQIHLAALPLLPPFVILNSYFGTFPIPSREKEVIELYERVTHMTVDPGTL